MKKFIVPLWLLTGLCLANPVEIISAEVLQGTITEQVEALGTTKSLETAVITTDVTEKITAIHFRDGQAVKQGDLLVTLDDREERANKKAASATLAEAKRNFIRQTELFQKKAVSKSEWQDSEAAVHKAEGNLEAIEAQQAKLQITAPFDGVLGLRELSVGALVQPGDKITTIDDIRQIRVDFDIPSQYLARVRIGQTLQGHVSAYKKHNFAGKVDSIDTQVDPVTRTLRVRGLFDNPDAKLKPGLLMIINIIVAQRSALLIPEEALIKRGNKNFVFTILEQNQQLIAKLTPVKMGVRQPGQIEIRAGLKAGEKIIAHGVNKVRDGQAITIKSSLSKRHKEARFDTV